MDKLNNNNSNNSKSNSIFLKSCSKHFQYPLDIILLQKQVEERFICYKCQKDNQIRFSLATHIKELQNTTDETIIQDFPPLEDESLTTFLNDLYKMNLNDSIDKMNTYFSQLKTQIIRTIDQVQNETKQKITKLTDLHEQIMGVYNSISSKNELKNVINSQSENMYSNIQNIIDNLFINIQANTQKIKQKIDNFKELKDSLCFDFPQRIQDNVILMLKSIDFFKHTDLQIFDQHSQKIQNFLNPSQIQQQNIVDQLNFIKAFQSRSKNLNIERVNNAQIQIQKSVQNGKAFSYSNFILDPKKKYIFRIQIHSNYDDNLIFIGLIPELQKDNWTGIPPNQVQYVERGDPRGITKIIKGGNVFAGRQKINKEIEMRINLEHQLFRVANFPNYENVAELEDKTKIEENEQYRLAIELNYLGHKIIVTHFEIVNEFDNKM